MPFISALYCYFIFVAFGTYDNSISGYAVSDLTDETTPNWQISDADNSFSTRPFHIKYARQDVSLAVMVSFNVSIKDIEVTMYLEDMHRRVFPHCLFAVLSVCFAST